MLSRVFATRLTANGEEVLFERIPFVIRKIQEEVHEMVLNGIAETETSAIPEFYVSRLKPFFRQAATLLVSCDAVKPSLSEVA